MKIGRNICAVKLIIFFITAFLLVGCGDDIVEPEASGSLKLISTRSAGLAYGVFVENNLAFITNNDGLLIFSINDQNRPQNMGSIGLGTTFGVTINNGLAYTVGNSGISVIDVNEPSDPAKLGSLNLQGTGHRIVVSDSIAYIASSIGLEIVNITNPTNLTKVGTYNSGGNPYGVAYYEDIVYLADGVKSLLVIDVADLSHPQKLRSVSGTQNAWDVHIYEESLYLACHNSGIKVLSISNKQSPQIIGSYNDGDGGEALGIWGDDENIFVADNFSVEMININDPSNPTEVGTVANLNGAHDIYVAGSYVYVAEGKQGLMVLKWMP